MLYCSCIIILKGGSGEISKCAILFSGTPVVYFKNLIFLQLCQTPVISTISHFPSEFKVARDFCIITSLPISFFPWPRDSFLDPLFHFAHQNSLKNSDFRTSGKERGLFCRLSLLSHPDILNSLYIVNTVTPLTFFLLPLLALLAMDGVLGVAMEGVLGVVTSCTSSSAALSSPSARSS